jgi:hypothetical protein
MFIVKTAPTTHEVGLYKPSVAHPSGVFAVPKVEWEFLVNCVVKDPTPTDGCLDFYKLVTSAKIIDTAPTQDALSLVVALELDAPLLALVAKYGYSTDSKFVPIPLPPPEESVTNSSDRDDIEALKRTLHLNETDEEVARRLAKEVKAIVKKSRRVEKVETKKETKVVADKSSWTVVGKTKTRK